MFERIKAVFYTITAAFNWPKDYADPYDDGVDIALHGGAIECNDDDDLTPSGSHIYIPPPQPKQSILSWLFTRSP